MKLIGTFLAAGLLWLGASAALSSNSSEAAQAAALHWLGLVDSGNYSQSWITASSLFREKISQSKWETAVSSARSPFGKLISRRFESATPTQSLPGVPDGNYVVIRFASSFERDANAVETVTPMKDKDGAWHIAGYFIK